MLVPEWVVATAYFIVAVGLVATVKRDSPAMIASRMLLVLVCSAWIGFYVAVDVLDWRAFVSPAADIFRVLSRWFHMANAMAIGLMVWGRWYLQRNLDR